MKALAALAVLAALLGAGTILLGRGVEPPPGATIVVSRALGAGDDAGFTRATRPRAFAFPADYGPHPGYRTEWWYYTGTLTGAGGRGFGYQLTFFRIALGPTPAQRTSAWSTTDVYMAHFAVTDVAAGRFYPHVRFARGAAGLAGAGTAPYRVWAEDWSAAAESDSAFPMRLRAAEGDVAIDLTLETAKPPVLQGRDGLSRKGPEPGNASYYYSLTRMPTRGTIRVGSVRHEVRGASWMDREWSTSALGEAVGWDWFALQLADGRDLMLYRLRQPDGSTSPWSAGSVVPPDGTSRPLAAADMRIETLAWWTAPGEVRYPARWRIVVPSAHLDLEVIPRVADQEYRAPIRYWEGAVNVRGTSDTVHGVGYVELVGYAVRPSPRPIN